MLQKSFDSKNQSLRALTIKQLADASANRVDDTLVVDGREVSNVSGSVFGVHKKMQDALAVGCGGLQELGAGVAIWMGRQLVAAGGDRPRPLRRCCRRTDRALTLLLDCRSPLWARCCLPASRASPTAWRLMTAPERPQS